MFGEILGAVAGGVAGLFGGGAGAAQAREQRRLAEEQLRAYREAQAKIGAAADKAISDVEAANMLQRGLINSATFDLIKGLNETEQGAINVLKQYESYQQQGLDDTLGSIIKVATDTGAISRDMLTGSYLSALQSLYGLPDSAFTSITGGNPEVLSKIKSSGGQKVYDTLKESGVATPYTLSQDKFTVSDLMAQRDAASAKYAQTGDPQDKIMAEKANQAFQAAATGLDRDIQNNMSYGGLPDDQILNFSSQAKENILAFNESAAQGLDPYVELGKRAAENLQYLSGTMTPEERKNYENKFGEITGSPLFEWERKQQEKSLSRQNMAMGKTFSGEGQKRFIEGINEGAIARESQRKREEAFRNTQLGLSAASQQADIRRGTGSALASIDQNTGLTLAQLKQQRNQIASQMALNFGKDVADTMIQEATMKANALSSAGAMRNQNLSQTGTNISNLTSSFGSAKSTAGFQGKANEAALVGELGAQKANIGMQSALNQANTLTSGASQYTALMSDAARTAAEASTAIPRGILQGGLAGAGNTAYNEGLRFGAGATPSSEFRGAYNSNQQIDPRYTRLPKSVYQNLGGY